MTTTKNEPEFFPEDLILKVKTSGDLEFGKVIYNCDMSDYGDTDEDDEDDDEYEDVESDTDQPNGLHDDDDDDNRHTIPEGSVRVEMFPTGKDCLLKEDQLILADRSVMSGDVVKRRPVVDPSHEEQRLQKGFCQNIRLKTVLKVLGTKNHYILNVDSKKLRPLQEFYEEVGVTFQNWIGIVRRVNLKIHLRFRDGTICVMKDKIAEENLYDVKEGQLEASSSFGDNNYYPGQIFCGDVKQFQKGEVSNQGSVFKKALKSWSWRKSKTLRAVVTNVEVVSLIVSWNTGTFPGGPPPCAVVKKEDLDKVRILNIFESETCEIGDKKLYTLTEQDVIVSKTEWIRSEKKYFEINDDPNANTLKREEEDEKNRVKNNKEEDTNNSDMEEEEDKFETESDDDDEQEEEEDKSSSSTTKAKNSKKTKKRQKKKLKSKPNQGLKKSVEVLEVGQTLVVQILNTKTTCDVRWQDSTQDLNVPSRSLVPLNHLDDQEFFFGDYVNLLPSVSAPKPFIDLGVVQKVDPKERICSVRWIDQSNNSDQDNPKITDVSVYDLEESYFNEPFRPGVVVVRTMDFEAFEDKGDKSLLAPGKTVPRPTTEHPYIHAGQVVEIDGSGKVQVHWADGRTELVWPRVLLKIGGYDSEDDYLWGLDDGVEDFDSDGKPVYDPEDFYDDEDDDDEDKIVEKVAKFIESEQNAQKSKENKSDESNAENLIPICAEENKKNATCDEENKENATCDEEELDLVDPSAANQNLVAEKDLSSFCLEPEAPKSHKFYSKTHAAMNPQLFMKTARKEIGLMQSSLPRGISVIGYEDRMDLFSAVIVGPETTPYEDGLFFFHIQLPNDYPLSPPSVHYISYSVDRFNPNLYVAGTVCVSLLGTWSGKGSEKWSVGSNLLQLLVSIQGLILVKEPYYNEAGYEKQVGSSEGAENSRLYNERVILRMLSSSTAQIENPPKHFETFVKSHFEKSAMRLTKRVELWISKTEKIPHQKGPDENDKEESGSSSSPEFPLLPLSKGCCSTLKNRDLKSFKDICKLKHFIQ